MAGLKWTHNPPCEAELYLSDLFCKNKIEPLDTASKIQKEHAIFKQFSSAVFRANFKRLRDQYGLELTKLISNFYFYNFII